MNKSLECQHCGAPLNVKGAQARTVECAYCGTTAVLEPELHKVIARNTRAFAVKLYRALSTSFTGEELQDLIVRLNEVLPPPYALDVDNLAGNNNVAKARELVTWCQRRGVLQQLVETALVIRPSLDI